MAVVDPSTDALLYQEQVGVLDFFLQRSPALLQLQLPVHLSRTLRMRAGPLRRVART